MRKKILHLNTFRTIFLLFAIFLLAGCLEGDGGGSEFLSSSLSTYAGSGTEGSGGSTEGRGGPTPIVQPEPSSLLLLTSGLLGMAIYAKARLKIKNKR